MSSRIDDYLKEKYTNRDNDRFKDERGEYHASAISNCPRAWFWKFKQEQEDQWSPYFELGNVFEDIYGEALRNEFGEGRVKQDVYLTIHIEDDIEITGEADWSIMSEDAYAYVEHVEVFQDGSREITYVDDTTEELGADEETPIDLVIETKTTKKISWREKYGYKEEHEYQVMTYMHAFGCDGEIAYMTRNELDEMVFDIEYDPMLWKDMVFRVKRHHMNLGNDVVPATEPLTDRQCKWCDFRDQCQLEGGSVWE